GQDYYLINPFQDKAAFNSLEQDISGFVTACTSFLATNRLQTFYGNVMVENKPEETNGIRLPPVFESIIEHLTLFESRVVIGSWNKASQLIIEVIATKGGKTQTLYKATFYNDNNDQPSASNVKSLAIEKLSPKVTRKVVKDGEDQFLVETQLLKFEPHDIDQAKVIITYTPDTSRYPSYPLKDVSYLDNKKY
ncbi:hypothetical protein ACTXNA_13225, partial [Psychrobacter celer]